MPKDMIYDIINLTARDMVANVEKKLSELRSVCKNNEEFASRTQKVPCDDYDIYLFDEVPAFYTRFWFEDMKIYWTLNVGDPPIDWRKYTYFTKDERTIERLTPLEEYLTIVDEPKFINEFYELKQKLSISELALDEQIKRNGELLKESEIVKQFQELLGTHTTTQALSKVSVLMREESDTESELNKYKKLMNSIYEIVSVDCADVGETFAGIKSDIDDIRQGKY